MDRKTLWRVLEAYGTPKKLIDIIKLLHERMDAKVVIGGDTSDASPVNNGVKRVVSYPTLFTLYVAMALEIMNSNLYYILYKEVYINTRLNGKLFNLVHFRASARTREVCVREMLYADDSVLVTNSLEDVKEITDRFADATGKFGLKISADKTELLYQPLSNSGKTRAVVNNNGEPLKEAETFIYLAQKTSPTVVTQK